MRSFKGDAVRLPRNDSIVKSCMGYSANYNCGSKAPSDISLGDAAKIGRSLQVNCSLCGTRFFDILGGIKRKKLKSHWSRSDVLREFRCGKSRCPIRRVALVSSSLDCEWGSAPTPWSKS